MHSFRSAVLTVQRLHGSSFTSVLRNVEWNMKNGPALLSFLRTLSEAHLNESIN